MAKFTKTYNIELGDRVEFRTSKDSLIKRGTVQDISEFPDVWVEVGFPNYPYPEYNRYKISVNLIEDNIDNEDWYYDNVQYKENEVLEFVYDDINERKIIKRYEEE